MAGQPRPRWGWHQLDNRWARRLVADAGIGPGDLVLDVGAGHGRLTGALLAAQARVIAVELHARRARVLGERFAGRPVTVVRADAADLRLPTRPFRVVANPPFAVLAPLLRRLVAPGSQLESAHLVVPRHVARTWTAAGAPGRNRWAGTFAVDRGRPVPRWALSPTPPHDAVVLVVRRREPGPGRGRAPPGRRPAPGRACGPRGSYEPAAASSGTKRAASTVPTPEARS